MTVKDLKETNKGRARRAEQFPYVTPSWSPISLRQGSGEIWNPAHPAWDLRKARNRQIADCSDFSDEWKPWKPWSSWTRQPHTWNLIEMVEKLRSPSRSRECWCDNLAKIDRYWQINQVAINHQTPHPGPICLSSPSNSLTLLGELDLNIVHNMHSKISERYIRTSTITVAFCLFYISTGTLKVR